MQRHWNGNGPPVGYELQISVILSPTGFKLVRQRVKHLRYRMRIKVNLLTGNFETYISKFFFHSHSNVTQLPQYSQGLELCYSRYTVDSHTQSLSPSDSDFMLLMQIKIATFKVY